MRPPRVLVAYASRHESTAEIATVIATELDRARCRADLQEVRLVDDLTSFDAAVIGSALYLARWDAAAVDLVRRERAALAAIPTWLFSSGPVGAGPATARPQRLPQPEDVAALAEEIGAHSTTFGGRVDPAVGDFEMEILATAGLAGDWRDFRRIRSWARTVATDVLARQQAEVPVREPGPSGRGTPASAGEPAGPAAPASAGEPAGPAVPTRRPATTLEKIDHDRIARTKEVTR